MVILAFLVFYVDLFMILKKNISFCTTPTW